MNCKKGIWVPDQGMNVPCGQCMPCRINKGRLWSARIIMEWLYTEERCYFLTFTIAPEHECHVISSDGIPVATLEKKKFLKWLENSQRYTGPFRYYAIGEYGENTFRPHYHLAIFPKRSGQAEALPSLWQKGFTTIAELNHERARYLANYTAKKLTKDTDERLERDQEPEFRTSSKNPPLGSTFVDQLYLTYTRSPGSDLIKDRGDVERTFRIDGRIYPLGNWPLQKLRKKLGIPLLHRDRIKANPEYLNYHESQEAEWDLYEAENAEKYLNAKKNQKIYRGESQKV